jgi:hypothetical protein
MTAQYYETIPLEEKATLMAETALQAYIESIADIDYQCFFLKINRWQFYELYLWKRKVKR